MRAIKDPAAFFRELGQLHDAHVESIILSGRRITVAVHDIYWGLVGEPDYRGPEPGSVVFDGLEGIELAAPSIGERLLIYGVEVTVTADRKFSVAITFSPSGRLDLRCSMIAQLP